ncbi:MAG: Calx-beta domain-containing protein [Desulfobacterales bacterium]|nr:Calx-beta domain-containing protein [Desulfobacterales bacterium]MDD4072207.1 Calx-beta domain-containing protein [Desulfobacterales bacterium]MDD4393066.1 Calx-beta domain-containing protein [Desulfobacterales bacterium]
MVTTLNVNSDLNTVLPGEGYDGVVRISIGGLYGTGALLYDGQAILTVAHLIEGNDLSTGSVLFDAAAGLVSYQISDALIHPEYDPADANSDLALLWLTDSVPADIDRYALYHQQPEPGQIFTMVGYGLQGTGLAGTVPAIVSEPVRIKAQNTMDGDAGDLKLSLGSTMAWSPVSESLWVSDFDSGFSGEDALGEWLSYSHTGLGANEGLIAPGDSGGPAFIDGQIAGVADYTASLSTSDFSPDIDDASNSSFGEIAFWQNISYFDDWIDQSLRAHYPDAPSCAGEVQKTISEGDAGTSLVYFLVEFNGERDSGDQILSVDYRTLDGTAKAGDDFIGTQGTLLLYENEYQAVIPVEVIGDNLEEPDEIFYLEISNPVGGSFSDGQITLTAQRTIIDDDWA